MKVLLKKEHKITDRSLGQTCFTWSKNVRDLALGRPAGLNELQRSQLREFIDEQCLRTSGGRLQGMDIQAYIEQTFGVIYRLSNIYRLLHEMGFSWITSRSKHPKQAPQVQETFKKLPTGNDPLHP